MLILRRLTNDIYIALISTNNENMPEQWQKANLYVEYIMEIYLKMSFGDLRVWNLDGLLQSGDYFGESVPWQVNTAAESYKIWTCHHFHYWLAAGPTKLDIPNISQRFGHVVGQQLLSTDQYS